MLDIHTIVVMLIVSAVLMTLTLSLGVRGRAPGLRSWNAGLGLFALAWVLIAARAVLPGVIGVALADALLLAGLCWQCGGMLEFNDYSPHWTVLAAPPVLLFLALLPLLDSYAGLTAVASAAFGAALAALGVFTARVGARAGPVRW